MKKFLLLAVAALCMVGCRKLSEGTPFPNPIDDEDEIEFTPIFFDGEFDYFDPIDPGDDDDTSDKDGTVSVDMFIDDRPYYHYEALYEGKFKPTPDPVVNPYESYFEFTFKEGSFDTSRSNFSLEDAAAEEVFKNKLGIGNGLERYYNAYTNAEGLNTKFYKLNNETGLGVFAYKNGADAYAIAFKCNSLGLISYLEEYVTTQTGKIHTIVQTTFANSVSTL